MKFGIGLAFSQPRDYCEMAVAAEASGWDYLALSDHVVHPEKLATPYPYTKDGRRRWEAFTPWPDPWVAIGALAAVTQRLRFVTNVFVLPQRHPLLVAKAIGTAAVMSDDRVALGVGVGWSRDEFDMLGQDFKTRGKRADEMIEVLRKLWTGEMVEHHGRFYDFDRLEMSPAPKQPVPIYVGGLSEAAFRRAAELGDGWISDVHTVEELRRTTDKLHAYRRACGRQDEDFTVIAAASDAFDVDGYRRMEDAGVTHLMTMPWLFYGGSTDSLPDKKDGLRRFADDVIAKMS